MVADKALVKAHFGIALHPSRQNDEGNQRVPDRDLHSNDTTGLDHDEEVQADGRDDENSVEDEEDRELVRGRLTALADESDEDDELQRDESLSPRDIPGGDADNFQGPVDFEDFSDEEVAIDGMHLRSGSRSRSRSRSTSRSPDLSKYPFLADSLEEMLTHLMSRYSSPYRDRHWARGRPGPWLNPMELTIFAFHTPNEKGLKAEANMLSMTW